MGDPRTEYTYPYPRPMVTVDWVVLTPEAGGARVLLVRRGAEPYKGRWALPGGFVEMEESLEAAACRELAEETGVRLWDLDGSRSGSAASNLFVKQMAAFGDPKRDPRGRTISVAYLLLLPPGGCPNVEAGDDAAEARWFGVRDLPDLAFDHRNIIARAVEQVRRYVTPQREISAVLANAYRAV
jgi:8-oxo-dGTP diphosphatase